MTQPSASRRRALAALLGVAGVPVLGACGTPPTPGPSTPTTTPRPAPDAPTSPTPTPTPTPTIPAVTVESNVGQGETGVTVDTILSVKVKHGTLKEVTATAQVPDRQTDKLETVTVPGKLDKDSGVWKATDGLDPGAEYTVTIKAVDEASEPVTLTRTFRTHDLTLDQQTFPSIYPLGGTVGIAMPIIIRFDIPVSDRANVEKHLHVHASPKQTGSWYWVNDSEVHYRPKSYWKAGTKVTVDARLNGVKAGKDLYGQETRTWSFDIGRSVIAKVNLDSDRLKVYVNGKHVRTIKVSAGKPGFTTRSGVKVISQKLPSTRMTSETEDVNNPEYYDLDNVRWCMRLTNSGEFFHAAPWNAAYFGRANVSHGCTGMSTADAKWLYDTMAIGDPAEFTGSNRGMEAGNGYTDWNLSWKEITKRSAL